MRCLLLIAGICPSLRSSAEAVSFLLQRVAIAARRPIPCRHSNAPIGIRRHSLSLIDSQVSPRQRHSTLPDRRRRMKIRTSHSKMQSTTVEDTRNPEAEQPHSTKNENDRYIDRSDDLVARVRAAREAAQRRMDAFGDVSEYEACVVRGRKSKLQTQPSEATSQSSRPDESHS